MGLSKLFVTVREVVGKLVKRVKLWADEASGREDSASLADELHNSS